MSFQDKNQKESVNLANCRSSRPEVFCNKGVVRNWASRKLIGFFSIG